MELKYIEVFLAQSFSGNRNYRSLGDSGGKRIRSAVRYGICATKNSLNRVLFFLTLCVVLHVRFLYSTQNAVVNIKDVAAE